jgi:iron complex outermembrane recepter protein
MLRRNRVSAAIACAFGGLAAVGVNPAFAQETQRIEITGSSIKRIDAESSLPVTTIQRRCA